MHLSIRAPFSAAGCYSRDVHDSYAQKSDLRGQQRVVIPERVLVAARRETPLLDGLLAEAAGYAAKYAGPLRQEIPGARKARFIYCVNGGGWCEMQGRLHTVRAGDLLVLPPATPQTCGAHASNPWSIHWVDASGENLQEYLKQLEVSAHAPVLRMGEDLELSRLFNEIRQALERGGSFTNLLQASNALGYLLALLIRNRREPKQESSDTVQRVAQSIIYMSEHLDQPLRVAGLAGLAHLSAPHFCVLFKQQTGCSPREYLHLLRIHKACQLLRSTVLNVKEIAARLGYQDQFHFSRQFKAFQGLSPTEYRK
jgi:AraC family transcriptional regulator, arabinose operon regulatory protein